MALADLLQRDPRLLQQPDDAPAVLDGEVHSTGPLRVVVPALDGGAHAPEAFGHYPDAAEGDPVKVMVDSTGGLVVLAWEPA